MYRTVTDHATAAIDGAVVALLLVVVAHLAPVLAAAVGFAVYAGMVLLFAGYRRHLRSLQPRRDAGTAPHAASDRLAEGLRTVA